MMCRCGECFGCTAGKIEWNGASNVAPKRKVLMPHLPWLCPACGKITNPGYRAQCILCGAERLEDL